MVHNHLRYRTRANDLSCVAPRVNGFGKSFCIPHSGICLWNDLPISVKQCHTRDVFKKQLKSSLWIKLDANDINVFVT